MGRWRESDGRSGSAVGGVNLVEAVPFGDLPADGSSTDSTKTTTHKNDTVLFISGLFRFIHESRTLFVKTVDFDAV